MLFIAHADMTTLEVTSEHNVETVWRQWVRAINSCKSQIYMRGTTKIRATFYWLSRSSRIWRVVGADNFIWAIFQWPSSVINVNPTREAKYLTHFNWNGSCWKNGVKDCCSVYVKLVACKFPSHTKSETVNNFFEHCCENHCPSYLYYTVKLAKNCCTM